MKMDLDNITIYEAEYEVKTPLKIDKEYLPGSSIRGSILTRLFEMDGLDVKKESIEPSLIFHPAFPIDQESKQLYRPAHPFIFKCKICNTINDELDSHKGFKQDDISALFPFKCKNNHLFSLKSLGGKLVIKNNDGKIVVYKDKRVAFYSVGINKILGSSEINMLYHDNYRVPDTRFRGLIVTEDSEVLDNIAAESDNIIYLGRGGSRGFGHTLINIKRVDDYIDKRREIIKSILKRSDYSYILLRALSPIFNIELNENGLVTATNIKIDGMSSNIVMTGTTKVSGFSLLSNIQKINLNAIGEGSIICLNIKEYAEDYLIERLIKLELFGVGPFSTIGLNIVEVLG